LTWWWSVVRSHSRLPETHLADVRAQHFCDLAVKCRDMVVRQPEVE